MDEAPPPLLRDPVVCPELLALLPFLRCPEKRSERWVCVMCVTPGGWEGGGGGQGDLVLLWGELWVLQGANL